MKVEKSFVFETGGLAGRVCVCEADESEDGAYHASLEVRAFDGSQGSPDTYYGDGSTIAEAMRDLWDNLEDVVNDTNAFWLWAEEALTGLEAVKVWAPMDSLAGADFEVVHIQISEMQELLVFNREEGMHAVVIRWLREKGYDPKKCSLQVQFVGFSDERTGPDYDGIDLRASMLP